ncbi:glycosyltransferase family 2 protein [Pseudomonadota bacterium]
MNSGKSALPTSDSFLQPNEFHGRVKRVEADLPRPLWSVLVPVHNCARYLEQTLYSVLDQDCCSEQMEIIVIDDFSTEDDPEAVVQTLGEGRVQFIRQAENVGKAKNYLTGLNSSRGNLIHLLHGDDLVGDGFYKSMADAFVQCPEAGAFFCETEYIDSNGLVKGFSGKESNALGILDDWLEKLVVAQRIQTPSIVVRREVYESLGGFDSRLPYCEDWEMWVRVATSFSFGFNPDVRARYRVHSKSTSSQSVVSGKRARVIRRAVSIMDSYLPAEVVTRCKPDRSRELAYYFVRCIPQTVEARKPRAWLKLCWESIRYSMRPRVLYDLLYFTLRYRRFLS